MQRWLRPLVTVLLSGCWGSNAYILEGTVLEVRDGEVVVDHDEVYGLMGPMVMPFRVTRPDLAADLKPGDRIVARLMVEARGGYLDKVRVTGHTPLPPPQADGAAPVRPGQTFPRVEVPVTGSETWVIGEGQPSPTVLTFVYTRCPMPEFCPMVVSRLQALQDAVGDGARLLAVTLDPAHDTLEVLSAYGEQAGARTPVWRFGRLESDSLQALALRAALPVSPSGDDIVHGLRWLVLDSRGRLVERYDDNAWPLERVVRQLRTGGPPAPPGSDGTISRLPTE